MEDNEYQITLRVGLDESKLPEKLSWEASGMPGEGDQEIKAFLLAMFDLKTRDTLKIDLWTKDFQVMEMDRFFYQTLRAMSDTYHKATHNEELAGEMRKFTQFFGEKTGIILSS